MNIGFIGTVNHGKPTLTAGEKIIVSGNVITETIPLQQIIEEQKTIKLTPPPQPQFYEWRFKTGKESRRERRAREREAKKKR